jgi:segregation and condensation protein B
MDYEQEERSFTIEEIGGGFRLYTRPEYAPWVSRLKRREKEFRLSPAALETLAIVAYRQPVLRAEVEKIRGVDVGGALKTLIDRGLVKVVGRAEEPGSPLLYGTTKRFLESFGLKDLGQLPRGNELER